MTTTQQDQPATPATPAAPATTAPPPEQPLAENLSTIEQAVAQWEAAEAATEQETEAQTEQSATTTEQTTEQQPTPPVTESEEKTPANRAIVRELARVEHAYRETKREREQLKEQLTKAQDLIALAKDDPVQFFQRSGIDVEQFANHMIAAKDKADPHKLELARLREQVEQLTKAQEESRTEYQRRQWQEAARVEQERLGAFVSENSQTYPYLAAYEPEEVRTAMYNVVADHYQRTRTMLDPSIAARQLDGQLRRAYERLHGAATKNSAVATPNNAAPPKPPAAQAGTNTIGRGHASATTRDPGEMSEEERLRYAAQHAQACPDSPLTISIDLLD
jgi:hypothetical protein